MENRYCFLIKLSFQKRQIKFYLPFFVNLFLLTFLSTCSHKINTPRSNFNSIINAIDQKNAGKIIYYLSDNSVNYLLTEFDSTMSYLQENDHFYHTAIDSLFTLLETDIDSLMILTSRERLEFLMEFFISNSKYFLNFDKPYEFVRQDLNQTRSTITVLHYDSLENYLFILEDGVWRLEIVNF